MRTICWSKKESPAAIIFTPEKLFCRCFWLIFVDNFAVTFVIINHRYGIALNGRLSYCKDPTSTWTVEKKSSIRTQLPAATSDKSTPYPSSTTPARHPHPSFNMSTFDPSALAALQAKMGAARIGNSLLVLYEIEIGQRLIDALLLR